MRLLHLTLGLLAVGLAACGGVSVDATLAGSYHGMTFTPRDAVFATTSAGSVSATYIALWDTAGVCTDFSASQYPRSSQGLVLYLSPPPTAPGQYDLGWASYDLVDAACNVTAPSTRTGSITVTALSTQSVSGTYELMFGSDRLSGHFTASSCLALVASTGMITCSGR